MLSLFAMVGARSLSGSARPPAWPRRALGSAVFVAAALTLRCSTPNERARSLLRQGRDGDAVLVLRRQLVERPYDVAARRLLVRVLAEAGDLTAARREVAELAARLSADDPTPPIELGHAYELAHFYDEALASYDDAARIAPARPDGPREGGMRCAQWGMAEEAWPRLEEAVRRGAHDAALWHALGLVRLQLGNEVGAANAYREGVSSDPNAAENWLGLATVELRRGDARAALEAYAHLMALRPRFASGELGRAWALALLGRREDAARALDQAEALGAPLGPVARQRESLRSSASSVNDAALDGGRQEPLPAAQKR